MKKAKEFNFSADKEVSREEMRAMNASDSGSGSGGGVGVTPPEPDPIPGGSGSGSGGSSGSWYEEIWEEIKDFFTPAAEAERNRQKKACEGQALGSACSWNGSGGITTSGTCNWDSITEGYYCTTLSTGGPQSGTGGFSSRQAACLNKSSGASCSFVGSGGTTMYGTCRIDNSHWFTAMPLTCYQPGGGDFKK